MSAAGFAMLAVAILVAYEAFKHLQVASASSSSSAPSGPATSPSLGGAAPNLSNSGLIPQSWLLALARHESPSALRGNFSYGAFGLQCGAGQGVTQQCTGPIPGGAGDVASYDLFASWEQAVQGLTAWINRNAPSAWQATTCEGFMRALQSGNYGGGPTWPNTVCSLQ